MSEILNENRRLQAEVEKLIEENMNLTSVIRTLRKNLRHDNEKLETVSRELWLWKNGRYHLDCVATEDCKSEAEVSSKLAEALRERDEAREHWGNESMNAAQFFGEKTKAIAERDEARAERDILKLNAQREAEHHDRMVSELEKVYKERDEAREKIKRQAERICQLEGATNHAGGTPLSIALRERDEVRQQYDDLATEHVLAVNKLAEERDQALMDRANGDMATMTINHYERILRERDEARSDAAKIADKLSGLELRSTEELARLEQERNEALAQVKELIYISERAIALAEIDFENDKFGVVSELRDDLAKIKKSK
jgi:hypothetical protein